MSRILSGVRPSGDLHIGNYLGALKQWVELQNSGEHETFFMLVDLHALDTIDDAETLRQKVREVAALYVGAGIDPTKSAIFAQSDVPAHTQLMWILSSRSKMGDLERMTQFKDKAAKGGAERVNLALFSYPILMAADILLYQANLVPVGDDQVQHLEFARDLAKKFNNTYNKELFTIPERFAGELGARVMSLSHPEQKMSKSDDDPKGTLPLLADDDTLRKNVMRAVTDSGEEVKGGENKPALNNLIELFAALEDTTTQAIEQRFEGKGYGDFKSALADAIVETIAPIRERAQALLADTDAIDALLAEGAMRANAVANQTLETVSKEVGLR